MITVDSRGCDVGMVCDLLHVPEGGRARCNCRYPPRYCPLKNGEIVVGLGKKTDG